MSLGLFREGTNQPGMLVTVDGPNGSGKTSLTEAVSEELQRRGIVVHRTHQPSASALGTFVRESEASLRGRGLACIVAADRHQQVEGEIGRHLSAGQIVICDRYIESSLVLQRIDGVAVDFILAINAGIARPDLRVRLKADSATIKERLASRPEDPARRFERTAAGERELELYEKADRLLADDYGLVAHVYDTTETDAADLGATVTALIEEERGRTRA